MGFMGGTDRVGTVCSKEKTLFQVLNSHSSSEYMPATEKIVSRDHFKKTN